MRPHRLPLDHFKHLPRDILALLLDVGEDADLYRAVAEGDLDDVADLDRVAGLPLTSTRPASATSLARVRRLMTRLTFRYLSKRIRVLFLSL